MTHRIVLSGKYLTFNLNTDTLALTVSGFLTAIEMLEEDTYQYQSFKHGNILRDLFKDITLKNPEYRYIKDVSEIGHLSTAEAIVNRETGTLWYRDDHQIVSMLNQLIRQFAIRESPHLTLNRLDAHQNM